MTTTSIRYSRFLPFSVGFALFAMFFGAGNLVFPLAIGVHAGDNVIIAMAGFLLSGVVMPLFGLIAIILYDGSYMRFLANLGRYPAFVVAATMVFLLGILVITPRTALVSYNTFIPLFPWLASHRFLFGAIFFIAVYLVSIKQMGIVDALGWILSPMKLIVLFILISFGVAVQHQVFVPTVAVSNQVIFTHAVKLGYGTMDLLASFFLCAFAYQTICHKLGRPLTEIPLGVEQRIMFQAALINTLLLGVVYSLFLLIANYHSALLQQVATQKLIGHLALVLLHRYGTIFVAICVTLACFASAIAATAFTVEFVQSHLLRNRFGYQLILPPVLLVIFMVSNLGFTRIMAIAIPILTVIYPALLALTLGNILHRLYKRLNIGPVLFYSVLVISIVIKVLQHR